MKSRELAVVGALEFTPEVFADDRGLFTSQFQDAEFAAATGRRLFPVAQASHSRSRRGVVRGVHYTATPPGMATYVYCARGRALDIVVDVRVGSPTFGQWDAVLLDEDHPRGVYLPVGVGHAFAALSDDTVMSYMLSGSYVAANELALSVFDPQLALALPEDIDPVLSERDRVAPTLAQALANGVLPDYVECREIEAALLPGATG